MLGFVGKNVALVWPRLNIYIRTHTEACTRNNNSIMIRAMTWHLLNTPLVSSGYKEYPDKNSTFDRLSYSEKLGSLWALSTEGNAFVYHPGQYWMKVSGSIRSISAGQYGIWAVNYAGQLLFRKRVNASHPEGTDWLTVRQTSYSKICCFRECKTCGTRAKDFDP